MSTIVKGSLIIVVQIFNRTAECLLSFLLGKEEQLQKKKFAYTCTH